jgi:ribose 5-phosphate isomerase A
MRVGWEIAGRVQSNQRLALGSGSTSEWAIRAIGARLAAREIENVYGVLTSAKVGSIGKEVGIMVQDLNYESGDPRIIESQSAPIDWGFDGADEVEFSTFNIIKGGGGASTIEKVIARKCRQWVVIVDETKMKDALGDFPVALEVNPDQVEAVQDSLRAHTHLSIERMSLRVRDESPFQTDLGNRIIDVKFAKGSIHPSLEDELNRIPGVVDNGLFMGGYPDEVLVAHSDGTIESLKRPGIRP